MVVQQKSKEQKSKEQKSKEQKSKEQERRLRTKLAEGFADIESGFKTQLAEANQRQSKESKKKSEELAEGQVNDFKRALKELASFEDLKSGDLTRILDSAIAIIDERLSSQMSVVLADENFQELEATWRGFKHLVSNTQTSEMLKIKYFNISKDELKKCLKKYEGDTTWDQSPIFKKIYEIEYGIWGGEPFGCLIGDYQFEHFEPDVALLGSLAQIAAAAHTPFIAAVAPVAFGMETWEELPAPSVLEAKFRRPTHLAWKSLREREDARYIGLTLPRFLSRLPYDPKKNPVEEFHFKEDVNGQDHQKYIWSNAVYALGVNINDAFKKYEWCSRIRGVESGGLVEDMHVHTFPTNDPEEDGGLELIDMKCPTEVDIPERRGHELNKLGLIPIIHRKNDNKAAFFSVQSLQKPVEYDDADATSNAKLSANLPYVFAACRFAHYLKVMTRDWIGKYTSAETLQTELNNWIGQYILHDIANATQADMARKPLADAEVTVLDKEGDPGFYDAKVSLRPHYQLEGLTASLSLVAKLPKQKAAT